MSYATKWSVAPLIDLLDSPLLNGCHQKGMEFGSGFKIVRMVDLYRGRIVNEESLDRVEYPKTPSDDYSLATGDILINRTSLKREGVAKASLMKNVSERTYFDCSIIRARPNTTKTDPDYLLRALNGPAVRPQIMRIAKTATITTVSQPGIRSLQIPLPPLAEQKRIAGILDAADALRAKRRESLAQLDTLFQSTFLDMFGDPVTNPMDWEASTLGEVVKVKSGDGLVAKDMAPDGEFPVYGGNGINGYHNSYMFEEPKVVLGRVGVNCGAVHLTRSKAWVTDNALYVREFLRPVDTTYIVEALKIANLNQYANQAAQPLISGNRIYPVTILLPPLDLQHRFAAIVESVEQQKASQRAHLDELDTLFASLQSRAFRGDL